MFWLYMFVFWDTMYLYGLYGLRYNVFNVYEQCKVMVVTRWMVWFVSMYISNCKMTTAQINIIWMQVNNFFWTIISFSCRWTSFVARSVVNVTLHLHMIVLRWYFFEDIALFVIDFIEVVVLPFTLFGQWFGFHLILV